MRLEDIQYYIGELIIVYNSINELKTDNKTLIKKANLLYKTLLKKNLDKLYKSINESIKYEIISEEIKGLLEIKENLEYIDNNIKIITD